MPLQPLPAGKVRDLIRAAVQRRPVIVQEAGALHKIIHAQGTGKTGGAGSWKRVVRSCEIVSQRLRCAAAQKDAPGVFDAGQQGKGVVYAQLQMLRGNPVDGLHGLVQAVCHNDLAVVFNGCPGDLLSGKGFQLNFDLPTDGFRQWAAVRYQHRRGQHVVFRLTQEIRRRPGGGGISVRQDQNFTGAGDHINVHQAKDLSLGCGHKNTAGTHNFIHFGYAFCTVGQGGDRLGTANLKHGVRSCQPRRRQGLRTGRAVPPGRRHQNNFAYTGNFRRDYVHQDRRGKCLRTPGHADAHPFNGRPPLAHNDAGAVR